MFHDRALVQVKGGRGGDGSLSFRREKYVPRGGPNGGDGGRGGGVILLADRDRRDLSAFRTRRVVSAPRGVSGRGANKHGADGEDIVLHVPVGTQVIETTSDATLADLTHDGERFVAAAGGAPGRGNARFATPTRQAPRFAETGLPGEFREIELRLKLVADLALAGLPNAGKSSLLRRLSNAKPKVAEYPFTTLAPVLGTMDGPDGRQLIVADVPGLIEGASGGAGLGHEFLAHLERARILVHVIDGSEGDADLRYAIIDQELSLYGAGLDERPQIVVLNKADLSPSAAAFSIADERILGVLRISCATGEGIDALKSAFFDNRGAPAEPVVPEIPEFLEYRPRPPARRRYRVLRTDRGFRVVGEAPGGVELEQALRDAGARRGAVVEVGDETFDWE